MRRIFLLILAIQLPFAQAGNLLVIDQSIETDERLMALSLRTGNDIWVVGTNASIFRSSDRGEQWEKITPPAQTEGAEFRDVEALDNGVVIVMSAGSGKESNIYRSGDNGLNWTRVLQASDDRAFFNCMTFEDDNLGWLYGDAVAGQLFVLKTVNGGITWQRESIPFPAQEGEGGFSSSGTCINSHADEPLLVGAGNTEKTRLLIKQGVWRHVGSPLKTGEAAGIFTLSRAEDRVYVSGGSLKTEQHPAQVFAYQIEQGAWQSLGNPLLNGAIYGSALSDDWLLVSNPQGISAFNLKTQNWQIVDSSDTWALECDEQGVCWGVGKSGNIKRISF